MDETAWSRILIPSNRTLPVRPEQNVLSLKHGVTTSMPAQNQYYRGGLHD